MAWVLNKFYQLISKVQLNKIGNVFTGFTAHSYLGYADGICQRKCPDLQMSHDVVVLVNAASKYHNVASQQCKTSSTSAK